MSADIQVLILEDDEPLMQAMAEVLEDEGYPVQAVADSQRAVDLSLERDFDLVITDIRMAGMDGLEALARVREVQPAVRSLVVTGFSSEVDTVRALRLGVGEYLSKPFRMEQFREAVERLVGQIRQERSRIGHERALRKLLIWALEGHAQRSDIQQRCSWLLPAGRNARELAIRAQLEEGGGESVQLAQLFSLFEPDELPDFVAETLPRRVEAILQTEHGLERSVMSAAGSLARGQPLDADLPPHIRQLAERLHLAPEAVSAREPARQRRSTLSLATALEQTQQVDAAIKAYQALIGPPPSREAVTAALGLARMAGRLGRARHARDYALQAIAISRHLGPLTLAGAASEAGVLLGSIDSPEAIEILEEALSLCTRLSFDSRRAQVELALASLRGESFSLDCLQVLLQSTSQLELVQSAWWLTPLLLEQMGSPGGDHPLVRRCLERMLSERPAAVHRLLQTGELSPPARLALVALAPSAEILQMLAADGDAQVRAQAGQKLGARASSPAVAVLRLFSLGPQEVFFGEERLPDEAFKKNQKARQMLAYLALERGRPVSEEGLAELFWPDEGSRGRKNLYSLRSIWKKALQPPNSPTEVETVVRTSGGLCLNPDLSWWHDLEELRRTLRTWEDLEKNQRQGEALALLRRAVQLYRGPFLEGCYMDWAVSVREQLEFHMMGALLRLSQLVLEQSLRGPSADLAAESLPCSEALEICQRVLEIDPCSQEAYRLSMQAYMQSGRPQEAIRLYERCVKVLQRELQSEPGIPLFEQYTRARMAL